MKQINIIRNNVITNSAQFETEVELNNWLQYHTSIESFGKPEHTIQVEISPEVVDENGTVIAEAQYEDQVVPSEFSVEIIDISSQLQQDQTNKHALELLASTDWKVLRHRDQLELGIPTSLTEQEFIDLLEQRQTARESIA
jgi:hypothetical protein